MVITFKFNEKTSTSSAITNGMIRSVSGKSIMEMKKAVGSKVDSAFYQNVRLYAEEFDIAGDYFAIKSENGYVFAFVAADRSVAHVKFRESKNAPYTSATYKLRISAKNQECYVVNTKTSEKSEIVKEVEIAETNESDEVAAMKAEIAALKAQVEQLSTALTRSEGKRRWNAKVSISRGRKFNSVMTMCAQGRNPVEVYKSIKNITNELDAMALGL